MMSGMSDNRARGYWWVRRAKRPSPFGEAEIVVRPWAMGLALGRTLTVLHDDGKVTDTTIDDATVEWGSYLGEGPTRTQALLDLEPESTDNPPTETWNR
jgi:hypothetical protein